MLRLKPIAITAIFLLAGVTSGRGQPCQDIENEVTYAGACTKIRTYQSQKLAERPQLLVVIHGDYFPRVDNTLYTFAKEIADRSLNLVAIGMVRPGFTDLAERTSDGVEGESVGDNYDEPRVRQVAGSITRLKQHYHASHVIVVGHSGGAAVTANLIALHPGLVDHAFILSCPCNINAWRKSMFDDRKIGV